MRVEFHLLISSQALSTTCFLAVIGNRISKEKPAVLQHQFYLDNPWPDHLRSLWAQPERLLAGRYFAPNRATHIYLSLLQISTNHPIKMLLICISLNQSYHSYTFSIFTINFLPFSFMNAGYLSLSTTRKRLNCSRRVLSRSSSLSACVRCK